jgi:hypothetical protein
VKILTLDDYRFLIPKQESPLTESGYCPLPVVSSGIFFGDLHSRISQFQLLDQESLMRQLWPTRTLTVRFRRFTGGPFIRYAQASLPADESVEPLRPKSSYIDHEPSKNDKGTAFQLLAKNSLRRHVRRRRLQHHCSSS